MYLFILSLYFYTIYMVWLWENNMFETPTEIYAVLKFNTQEIKNPFVKVLKSSTVINVRIPNKILQVQSYINQRIS